MTNLRTEKCACSLQLYLLKTYALTLRLSVVQVKRSSLITVGLE